MILIRKSGSYTVRVAIDYSEQSNRTGDASDEGQSYQLFDIIRTTLYDSFGRVVSVDDNVKRQAVAATEHGYRYVLPDSTLPNNPTLGNPLLGRYVGQRP